MGLFIILTVVSIAGVALRQSTLRYLAAEAGRTAGGGPRAFSWPAYRKWLRQRGRAVWSREFWARGFAALRTWAAAHYPGWLRWVFAALVASFLYQAASGFAFALASPRGMWGLPLLAHVGSGGLFALSLAAMLFWRARDYRFDQGEALSRSSLRKILFWAFAFFGLIQVTTALGSMLPLFTFETQLALIMIHRFSALAILLTVVVFADITFFPLPQTPPT